MQDKIKAIIIDDELGCVANLGYYLTKYCPAIEIVGTGSSKKDIIYLLQKPFDVAFMDIEIHDSNIFSILSRAMPSDFDIVFVTAFERYALKAFNVPVLDYILKPLSKRNILNCYEKILKRYTRCETKSIALTQRAMDQPDISQKVVLKHNTNVYIIPFRDIVYLEACGIYTKVHFYYLNKFMSVTVSKPLGHLEQSYPADYFFRIHYSFIVNREKIKKIVKKNSLQVVMCTDFIIPVAKRRAADFYLYMNIK